MKRTSITDIAKATNLSISTVSRVINGKAEEYRIGKKSQKLVLETAKRLNYKPNHAAAHLRSGKSRTIALLIPTLDNPFFASLASKINNDLREEGYTTILSESGENLEREKEILRNLLSRNIEGLIMVPCGQEFSHILELKNKELPIVCMDRYIDELDLPYVSTDNYFGAFEATKLLINSGHRNILGIQGELQSIPNQQRALGFTAALKEANIDQVNLKGDSFSVQNGYLETKLALQNADIPTAIFAFSNTIALGCLKALKEDRLSIPGDVSLICFDDHPFLEFLSAPITSVAQPVSDIARLSTRFLFSLIGKDPLESQKMLFKPQIIIRNSIKKI
ncbi:LacI family DNA-binding transcriptional regulator [Sinomicrobium soli]|uniref:LacI family DNA-binding transcriptional regulator n=1 Tax=Sinomicrobium sp. N-1-3-6 TaxID=2219864 RepID=UPI000DCECF1F|nr:LacI family DNA-binding transcriptional regulator [Sinomicrobium sp. N-1-3-6]RAV27803.1 transcriptional regulator [Sinomicrobium sp. N-1-3-6]